MYKLDFNTPALLFPAITLLMLAYTNRFLSLAKLVRKLHEDYNSGQKNKNILGQIKNLRARINLIRYMQAFSVISFLGCVLSMYLIFTNNNSYANFVFAISLILLLVSIFLSLLEIQKSTKAIELELSDIEELNKEHILKDMFN